MSVDSIDPSFRAYSAFFPRYTQLAPLGKVRNYAGNCTDTFQKLNMA
jgi:hypothetical protein